MRISHYIITYLLSPFSTNAPASACLSLQRRLNPSDSSISVLAWSTCGLREAHPIEISSIVSAPPSSCYCFAQCPINATSSHRQTFWTPIGNFVFVRVRCLSSPYSFLPPNFQSPLTIDLGSVAPPGPDLRSMHMRSGP